MNTCDYCERPTDELVHYTNGAKLCLPCRAKEQERVRIEFAEEYGEDYDKLATYQAEGR